MPSWPLRCSPISTDRSGRQHAAVAFLRYRFGTVEPLAKALRVQESTLRHVREGRPVSASIAIRVARLLGVPIDDVLAGRFPPSGTCPHCGRGPDGNVIPVAGIERGAA